MICPACAKGQHGACRDCPCQHKNSRAATGPDGNQQAQAESESR